MTEGPLRRANVEQALQVPKTHLRKWLETFEPLCSRETQARKASYYTRTDLGFLFLVKMLVEAGFDISQLQTISLQLHALMGRPVEADSRKVATLHFSEGWHVGGTPPPESLTLQIPVWAASAAADAYWVGESSPQQNMNLGVSPVRAGRRAVRRA